MTGRSHRSVFFAFSVILGAAIVGWVRPATSILDLYDLSPEAGKKATLPAVLQEISGLATTPDGRLFAHNDERGAVFELDPTTGRVIKSFLVGALGARGDFEGIAIAGVRFFLVTSRGQILEFREGEPASAVQFRVYELGLGSLCEMEGLAVDAEANTLLLPCKNPRRRELEGRLVVLSVPLDSLRLDPRPRISIPLKDLDERGLGKNFHPSSIEVHPETQALILVAAREEAMVELSRDGEILATRELKRRAHP
ncbi:MAG: hypothetical protein HKO65_10575, partial [Gemmatimonadetes bacterium]|nr:hypothetical protein [Gemmatimonadota bacterium]NNM05538.1 hypothetical protein [Gemmatimonadota bacterium]